MLFMLESSTVLLSTYSYFCILALLRNFAGIKHKKTVLITPNLVKIYRNKVQYNEYLIVS